jgi:protein-tyrosine-phosphatase
VAAKVLLEHYAHGRVEVRSAGSEPASQLNTSVVAVLKERGLDPSREFPKPLTDDDANAADVVVTMGCGDACPFHPGKRYLDWELEDPAGLPIEQVRPISTTSTGECKACLPNWSQTSPDNRSRFGR